MHNGVSDMGCRLIERCLVIKGASHSTDSSTWGAFLEVGYSSTQMDLPVASFSSPLSLGFQC